MPNYGDPNYWEERYKSNEDSTFDWLEDYETLKPIIEEFKLDKLSAKILVLGCGNSELSQNMYDDGNKNIYNIDISKNVITNMQKKNQNRPDMKCKVETLI
jgi:2-polyprenyl-3-methyl-5-hydroxy-6-metoxy-1,4-benzoquinol methylase